MGLAGCMVWPLFYSSLLPAPFSSSSCRVCAVDGSCEPVGRGNIIFAIYLEPTFPRESCDSSGGCSTARFRES